MIRCVRLWTDETLNSVFEEGQIDLTALANGDLATTDFAVGLCHFQETQSGGSWDWHKDPTPRLVITLSGTLEFEVRSGQSFTLRAGDILFAQDSTGSGHKWRLIDGQPWRRLYVNIAPGVKVPFTPIKSVRV